MSSLVCRLQTRYAIPSQLFLFSFTSEPSAKTKRERTHTDLVDLLYEHLLQREKRKSD